MKKIFRIITILLPLIFTSEVFSQINLNWENRFNGSSNSRDEGKTIITDNSGNIYSTGFSTNTGNGQDFTTIKYNSAGAQIWSAFYNGPGSGNDQSYLIALDNSGNVYVSGYATGILSNADFTTIKYNSNGSRLWTSTYNGDGNFQDFPTSLKVDQSGNVYVTGQSYGGSSTNYNMATIKYNPSGDQVWVSIYNGTGNGNERANSIDVDLNGNVYITGTGFETESGTNDFVTIKYNNSGTQEWVSKYNGSANGIDYANDLILDDSGNVYITGSSYNIFYDFATIKYNNSGDQQWVSRYNGANNGNDEPNTILLDSNGNIFVTGITRISGNFSDMAAVKYNNSGVRQWLRTFNGPGNNTDSSTSAVLDADGSIILTGFCTGSGSSKDFATIKYNNAGDLIWSTIFNGPNNGEEISFSVAVDNARDVYVTGKGPTEITGEDFITIKYSTTSGIMQLSSITGNNFTLYDNYPNPFNPSTQISFNIPSSSFVKLSVYDISGNLIETIINNILQTGFHKVNFNPSGLSSGVYFYTMEAVSLRGANNFIQTKKMIFVK